MAIPSLTVSVRKRVKGGHGELGELLVEDGWNSGGEDQARGHKQGPGPESKCCRM